MAQLAATRDRIHATIPPVKPIVTFFRQNPQVLVLVLVCLILGIGTFFAVVFGLISAGSSTTNGEPSGVVGALAALAAL